MSKRFPPVMLATCVLPWKSDFTLDEELFVEEIRLLRDKLTRHLYLFGTAGEGYAVSDRQFDDIVAIFARHMSGPHDHPMVGIISLSLQTIIERIERCCTIGINTFQISLPSWGALSDSELGVFFHEVCDRFPTCRFMHYNLSRSKRILNGGDYARLLAKHENLVAVKFGGGRDRSARLDLLSKSPELQFFFTEPGYVECRDQHECGLLVSLAICHLDRAREFFEARALELATFGQELDLVGQALAEAVGDRAHMDGAFDKMLIKLHLPQFPLRLLPPYSSCVEARMGLFVERLPPRWRPIAGRGIAAHEQTGQPSIPDRIQSPEPS